MITRYSTRLRDVEDAQPRSDAAVLFAGTVLGSTPLRVAGVNFFLRSSEPREFLHSLVSYGIVSSSLSMFDYFAPSFYFQIQIAL